MTALAAIGLCFGYPNHAVGRDVSLRFAPGEVVALLGPNGGGKSTFFKTLLGLLPPQGGKVQLGASNLAHLARREIARAVSYVPQAYAGYFPFTVRDVVTMGRIAHRPPFAAPTRSNVDRAEAALAQLALSHLADQGYTRISGGERQLVLIARALAQAAPLVVMDEPTANLDFGNQARVIARIKALRSAGVGILMATHDPDQAFLVADRVALFHRGRLLADASPDLAMTPENLRTVYGIDVEIRELVSTDGSRRRVCIPADI